ncbi:leucine-responsive transcriptional regulator [Halioglobus sp. HI00S01]|uniref:Lrp/AsnC ligand binding domain-containing protein n=1 Tax=Halioglobus sp. HI00S01 TaxID=1822214 RepID=UPI0007C31D8D|nr:Lrp/AsnC ligand binding domain-containing protein [Halioglobus sp. HI00S01]KZX60525.1 leucine-responsive transcriptional regulator [Halioglobus sp. HI00S01]
MNKRLRELDRTDRKILTLLQQDGRISNVDLAREVALSPTPCLERVRRLEREGYITGYVALADPARLNANTLAFIQVSLVNTSTEILREFNQRMQALPQVESCHMVAGGFDYLLKIRCADMQDYQQFLGEHLGAIPMISQTHTYVVIEEVKNETAIPVAPANA